MISETARKALTFWGKEDAEITLVAQRENIVFRIDHNGSRYALRLHRPGYQSVGMILSELAWVEQLGDAGMTVPRPWPTLDGRLLQETDGYQVDLLSWLGGQPLGTTGAALDLIDRAGTFRMIGRLMAQMHQISDQWSRPKTFERQPWDIDGLLGETPLWGRFWENPGLSSVDKANVQRARNRLQSELEGCDLDFGLIHADMVRENIMLDGTNLGLIDFDDSGFGFRLFDVATTLLKNRSEPDYATLEAAFLRGYRELRPLDTELLPQFTLIRALTYLGWIIPRMDEPGAELRQERFLESSRALLEDYLTRTN